MRAAGRTQEALGPPRSGGQKEAGEGAFSGLGKKEAGEGAFSGMWHAFTWSWKTPCARFQKPVFRKRLFTGFGSVTAPARQGSPDPP